MKTPTSPPQSATDFLPGHITKLLEDWQKGDRQALDQVIESVYAELRKLAAFYLQKERNNHTLQPTALVSEIYPKLIDSKKLSFANRGKFFAFVGKLMRHALIDHAREKIAQKRGGGQVAGQNQIPEPYAVTLSNPYSHLLLNQALDALKDMDAGKHDIFELWFYTGLDAHQIGDLMNKSPITIRRQLRTAKAWLANKLTSEKGSKMGLG